MTLFTTILISLSIYITPLVLIETVNFIENKKLDKKLQQFKEECVRKVCEKLEGTSKKKQKGRIRNDNNK